MTHVLAYFVLTVFLVIEWSTGECLSPHLLCVSMQYFRAIGFFNEADTLESNSILIYLKQWTSLYTRLGMYKAPLIKW
jgi:hypothetical protein